MKYIKILVVSLGLFSCQESDVSQQSKYLKKLPPFSGKDLINHKFYNNESLLNHETKAVYVHFWATWCGPCEKEFADFIAFAAELATENIYFLAIAVNDDEIAIKKFLSRLAKIPSKMIIMLESKNMSKKFGTIQLPETYLLDGKGNLHTKYIGPQNWKSSFYKKILKQEL